MQVYTKAQIGVEVTPQELYDFLNAQQRGAFICIHGYVPQSKIWAKDEAGESLAPTETHWVQWGCKYENMLARSISALESGSVLARIQAHGLTIKRNSWFSDKGDENPTARESKVFKNFLPIKRVYSLDNEDDKVKIVAALTKKLDQLQNPVKKDQGYSNVAKGTDSREGEPDGVLYFRHCMRVHKTVEKQGLAKPKATKEDTAIRDAVERLLPLKGYCSFKLADNFESITIGGQAVLQGANLSELDVALALPEALKEAELVTSAEKLVDALLGDTVHEESSKVLAEKLLA